MSLESKPPETVLELADRILSIILDEKADLDPSRYGRGGVFEFAYANQE